VTSRGALLRDVSLAIALTEQILARPLRSVLDVGAGEGRWCPVVQRLRPGVRYLGVEQSEWPVRHWGVRRNLYRGRIETLDSLELPGPFDLVVAADMLHYLPTRVLRRGLANIAGLVGGVAYCPTFTTADAFEGDTKGFQRRSPATYRKLFSAVGLRPIGMHGWVPNALAISLAALERG
jgi:cyclopropane fatty-acyl-phospholipid synthase-like methyltransferase